MSISQISPPILPPKFAVLLLAFWGTRFGLKLLEMKSKIKWAALAGLLFSFLSLLVHLFLAKSTANFVQFGGKSPFVDDLYKKGPGHWRLWGEIKALKVLHPYATPRTAYPAPNAENNGFIYAKIFGGFEKIRTSVCSYFPFCGALPFNWIFLSPTITLLE